MIQNIWAVGRNYVEHAKELGNEIPSSPLIFLKAGSSSTHSQSEIHLPSWGGDYHHEVEIALQFDKDLKIYKACIALDITEREIQAQLKSKGHPWTLAKSFKEACPLSPFFPVSNLSELENLPFSLKVNNLLKQNGNTNLMIFKVPELLKYVLDRFPVVPGDLLLTGTPAGVGPMKQGDLLEAEIVGKVKYTWNVK